MAENDSSDSGAKASGFLRLMEKIELLSELVKFLNIFVTIPTTSATDERSFSGLRRLKTYLRSTMGQKRLNSVSLLHFHKDVANEMDLDSIINEFIQRNDQRKSTFYQ
ncbi:hypothetical protein HELRODRAFT_173156 [Helobdella robusta]|uniref:HAT C-terminal dimerisation domain-containing protein n=1 Tax=Helobdella robusta TaxID=6412 RepID=T1F6G8_HELRO|nr:hypothetical protein HELRODRAFT_173156 [Helobdella robusta]ESO04079.1 hypothetical protein HELRODRAFT_173156 [Helobdella robusta]